MAIIDFRGLLIDACFSLFGRCQLLSVVVNRGCADPAPDTNTLRTAHHAPLQSIYRHMTARPSRRVTLHLSLLDTDLLLP